MSFYFISVYPEPKSNVCALGKRSAKKMKAFTDEIQNLFSKKYTL